MQEELRRNNSIGNSDGIDKFLRLVFDNKISGVEAINHSFRYHSLSQFNCFLALLLFEELDLLKISGNNIELTETGIEISNLSMPQKKNKISWKVINYLISEKLIKYDHITIDSESGKLRIPTNAFSLSAAIYRNFLYSIGCFVKEGYCFVFKNEILGTEIENQIIQEKKKLTQAELLQKLKEHQEDGEKGEIFVMEYEKLRLKGKGLSPKRVSVIDVGAGYDILSCQDSASDYYNRYIEVKSFRGQPHFFWSSNEKNIAEALGCNYYLYLVNLNELEKSPNTYIPQIICNPANDLFTDEWLVEPDSYRITYLK